ncbi:Tetraspanin family protein [Prunus dulcis]|uniref:Tetraspanin family protein n=1 Tax=Prunus dulcis TaxID=3755 RepID=A0A4Y1QTY8_PRUDU|nr:Tetraspanin family protein [Prunus dulcis]
MAEFLAATQFFYDLVHIEIINCFCLTGVGMAVCLSTLCGHIVAHRSSSSVLFIQLAKFIDKNHIKFKDFLIFHVNMCRLIVILILVPQLFSGLLGLSQEHTATIPKYPTSDILFWQHLPNLYLMYQDTVS